MSGDDRTFVLVGTSSLPGHTSTSYFELRLRPDGRPYPLIRLAISAPLPPSGATGDIALTASGSRLAIRVLDTSAAGSDLLGASRKLVGASPHAGLFHQLAAGQITATTRYVFALVSRPLAGGGPGNQVGIAAFSASTGAPSGVVNQFPQTGMGSYCGVLWTDRSGQRLVTSCGASAGLTSGHRFTEIGPRPRGFSLWSIYKNVPIAW